LRKPDRFADPAFSLRRSFAPARDAASLDLGRDARRGGIRMKTAIIALAAATALAWAGGRPRPRTIHKDGMTGPEVAAWLQKAGYKAELTKDESGDPLINSAAEGQTFKIYFYDCNEAKRCKALQFSAGFDLKTGPDPGEGQ
jgi:hypothetical protein